MLSDSEALSVEGIVHGTHEFGAAAGVLFGAGEAALEGVAEDRGPQLPDGELGWAEH